MGKIVTKKLAQDLIKNCFGLSVANLVYDDSQTCFFVQYGEDFWISIRPEMYKSSKSTYDYFYTDDMHHKEFYNDYYISVDIQIGGIRQNSKYTHNLKVINFQYKDDED